MIGLSRDAAKKGPLRRLIGVANAIGSRIIAEGLDSPEDVQVLADLGVAYAEVWHKRMKPNGLPE